MRPILSGYGSVKCVKFQNDLYVATVYMLCSGTRYSIVQPLQ
jgi:hypothetical protein